ncbi:MAG: tetratricopeptide repeat protein [Bacteroidales bacterium]|nr:tetratricopeptide repeat protein [Bacteroidales bacterium]
MKNFEGKIRKYIQDKEYDKALNELAEMLQKYPDDAKYLIIRGDLYYSMQKYSDALNDYSKVLKIESDNQIILSKVEMIREILRFEAVDIFSSTNLNNDPWLDN